MGARIANACAPYAHLSLVRARRFHLARTDSTKKQEAKDNLKMLQSFEKFGLRSLEDAVLPPHPVPSPLLSHSALGLHYLHHAATRRPTFPHATAHNDICAPPS